MALPLYLAMTDTEIRHTEPLPNTIAWMACHFSPYSTGLSNFPAELPKGSILIVNDRTPPSGHDPNLITSQLQYLVETTCAEGILLDFQRPNNPLTEQIAKTVAEILSCPVGISQAYAGELSCPVFLDPVPPHISLETHIAPWQHRSLWLDIAQNSEQIAVYADGSRISPLFPPEIEADGLEDAMLHCRYRIEKHEDHIQFTLWRSASCITALLREAEALGIQKAFGLYQQLGSKKPAD